MQKHYLRLLGNVDFVPEWEREILKSVRVRWEGCRSDDPRDWSVIRFRSQENRKTGVGARAHWCHADEPPREGVWREVRKAGEPGWPFPRFITATPLSRLQWEWLRKDYPKGVEGPTSSRFCRIRGDIEDIRGTILTDSEIAELVELYSSDPVRDARLHGEELDTDGQSPFAKKYRELEKWLSECSDGELDEWEVSREFTTHEGKQLVTEVVEVETWEGYDPMCVYRIVADPSLGIDDEKHDPGECVVWNMTTGTQCARYNGYIGEYGLGVLSAGLSRKYGSCKVDPDVTGGYGSAFLTGFRAAGGRNLSVRQPIIPEGGLERVDVGFVVSADTRPSFVGALLEALVHSEQGNRWLTIRCEDTVRELMELRLDEKNRPITAPGRHDEGFITAGRIATLLQPGVARQKVHVPEDRRTPRAKGRAKVLEEMGIETKRPVRGGLRPRPRAR